MTQLDGELPLELEIRKSWMSEWADWSKEACLIRVRSVFKKQHHSVNVLLHWLHTTGSNVATAKWVMGHSLKLCSLSLVLFEISRQIIKLLVCEEMCSCNDPQSNAMQLLLFIFFKFTFYITYSPAQCSLYLKTTMYSRILPCKAPGMVLQYALFKLPNGGLYVHIDEGSHCFSSYP